MAINSCIEIDSMGQVIVEMIGGVVGQIDLLKEHHWLNM